MPFDVIDEWFLALRARNLDVTAIQVLGQADINPLNSTASALAIDSETGQELELSLDEKQRSDYGILLMQHNQLLKQYLFDCRIPYALALSSQTLIDIIQGSVSETGLLRT